jgi:hypothetical protein
VRERTKNEKRGTAAIQRAAREPGTVEEKTKV